MNEPKPSLASEDNLPKLPTTPYDDEQFQKGYTAGYGAGYENGYSEGKTAGSDLTLTPKIMVTHAEGCWSWGPAHYECVCKELAKAKGWAK